MKITHLVSILITCAGCAARDQIAIVPPVAGAVEHTVLFATNREASDGMFDNTRSATTSFGQATVVVPPKHERGVVEYPTKVADPQADFGIRDAETTADPAAFNTLLQTQIAAKPLGERAAILYVHGFNSTFAEALFLNTQLMHDYNRPEIPILFSWPSSGSSLAYMHDHESIMSARTPMVTLLNALQASDLDSFIIVGHSMGSQLVMEALRQHAIQTGGKQWPKLSAVALIAPDIDVDVFAQLSEDMGGLPHPFLVIASENDKLLSLSGVINGSAARLGSIADQEALPDTNATIVSSSFATQMWSSNHMTAFRSPEMIDYLTAFEQNMP